jgi:ribosomal protein S27AE
MKLETKNMKAVLMEKKPCKRCGGVVFYKSGNHSRACTRCQYFEAKARRALGMMSAMSIETKKKNALREKRWRYSEKGITYYSARGRKRKYGMTPVQFSEIYLDQMGKCKICGRRLLDPDSGLHVDHCHKTDKVRGLLCKRCNLGLGQFTDNPRYLYNAYQYIASEGKNSTDRDPLSFLVATS